MNDDLCLLITIYDEADQLLRACAVKTKLNRFTSDVWTYWKEPAHNSILRALLPPHVRELGLGPIVKVEQIFEIVDLNNEATPL